MAASTQHIKQMSCQIFRNRELVDLFYLVFIYMVSVVYKPQTSNRDQGKTPCQQGTLTHGY